MKRRILVLCSGNSAKSQMAEALLGNNAGEFFDVASAGTVPEGIDRRTLEARQECANFPTAGELIAWDFADPKLKEGIAAFEVTLRELNERIKIFTLAHTSQEKGAL